MNDFWNYNKAKMAQVADEQAEVSASAVSTNPMDDDFNFPNDLPENPVNEDKPKEEPKVKENPNGTYKGFFFTPCDHAKRIEDELRKMAETDEELAKAIADGKKTFEGCDRFIRNNMMDLARELGKKEIVFDDASVHEIARLYMLGYICDVKSAVEKVAKTKTEKPKKEKKTETKPKAEKKAKVVPLTPQIGEIKKEEKKTKDGIKVDNDGQLSLF